MSAIGDVTGQGLGTLVRILDLATALKSGNLGTALTRQANLLTDPEARNVVAGSPFLSGFTGVYGSRQPVAVDAAPGGPSLPERQVQFRANLPNMPLSVDDQLKAANLALAQARIPLIESQIQQQKATAELLKGGTGGPSGALRLRQIGPSGPIFETQRGIDIPAGTFGPSGEYKPGDVTPSGEVIRTVRPRPGAARQNAQVAGQLRRLNAARNALSTAFGPRDDGTSALDLLPKAAESPAAGLLRTIPGVRQLTSAGEGPGLMGGTSIPRLAREGNRDATVLMTGTTQRAALARAFGEVGNLAEQEQRVVEQLLPSESDTREGALAKYQFAIQLLDNLEQGLATGQIDEAGAKAAILGAAGAAPSAPSPLGTTTTTTVPNPTGSSISPDQINEDLDWLRNSGQTSPRKRLTGR